MKRYDPRLWIGGLMILGGVLILLQNLKVISEVGDIFWGLIFGAVAVYFLQRLFIQREWWAAFPGFVLLGLALSNLLPGSMDAFSGLIFFGGIAVAFLWVYFSDTARWWAIIPAGVMLTLGVITVMENISGAENGGLLFLGLGVTFVLVAILPGGSSRSWALIPGSILLVFGALLGTPFGGMVGPVVFILLGGYLVVRFFMNRSSA